MQLSDIAKGLRVDAIPAVTYHRTCRSIFTVKRDLDAIVAKLHHSEGRDMPESRGSARKGPYQSILYEVKCIFLSENTPGQRGFDLVH